MTTPAPSADLTSTPLFHALNLANRAHSGQLRKVSPVPYLIHPLNVMRILADFRFPDVPFGVAALLHDVVEDGGIKVAQIHEEFGAEIAAMVEAVTYADKQMSWWDRRRQTVKDLETASENVLILTCADKFDNVSSIGRDLARLGPAMWGAFRSPWEMQCWYYRALSEVFQARRSELTAPLFDAFQTEVYLVFGSSTAAGGLF